ncbi:MAG: bifunctional adenosylcobinamide kinase/adenosylcobinamide-phosphate guanylyltransferase [Candidatus Bipolaricaulota bacterium]
MKLILGGARSGKSRQAMDFAGEYQEVVYLATGVATDEEMENRIARHKEERPESWETIEEPVDVGRALEKLKVNSFSGAVVLDCLGFWLSNLLREIDGIESHEVEDFVEAKVKRELSPACGGEYELIIVSNEVGMGVIPGSAAGRRFRDALGRANQVVGEVADEVYLMVAGFKLELKK